MKESDIVRELCDGRTGICVDIGAGDGIIQSNSRALYERGWWGLVAERCPIKLLSLNRLCRTIPVDVFEGTVTPRNVSDVLSEIPSVFEFLSLDIDGYDYFVLEALLVTHQPLIIACEINPMIPPPIKTTIRYSKEWEWKVDTCYGQSLSAAYNLLAAHGYKLHALVRDNAIFTTLPVQPKDLMRELERGFLLNPEAKKEASYQIEFCRSLMNMGLASAVTEIHREWSKHAGQFVVWI